MKKIKHLGIWMDYSNAYLLEFTNELIIQSIIVSAFTHELKVEVLPSADKSMFNIEKIQQINYFNQLKKSIKYYHEVLLFGPDHSKYELLEFIHGDPLCSAISINVKDALKMTENEMHMFIREYFNALINKV